jgi:DNA-binding response OmpR family regulator
VPRILLIDDNPAIRMLVKERLQPSYEVIESADATEGLALTLEHKPDCILLDLNLPKFSGLALCQTLMSVSHTQTIPIFIMSGHLGPDYRERYRHLGATDFFEKPVDFGRLHASLAAVLKGPHRQPRCEPRIRLKATLKLRGTAENGKEFELLTSTEDVSSNGFLCRCTIPLPEDSIVEVTLMTRDSEHEVGRARLRHTQWKGLPWQACGFQLVEKKGPWIL